MSFQLKLEAHILQYAVLLLFFRQQILVRHTKRRIYTRPSWGAVQDCRILVFNQLISFLENDY